MSRTVYVDGGLRVADSADVVTALHPEIPMTVTDDITEHGGPRFSLAEDASDLEVTIPEVNYYRHLLLVSDVVVQVKLAGTGSTPITCRRLWLEAGDLSQLHLTNLGLLQAEGMATAGGASTITDTDSQWSFSKLLGSRVYPPFTICECSFRMVANTRSGLVTVAATDLSGSEMAVVLQSAIDASDIGPSQVVVSYNDMDDRFEIESLTDGANAITASVYLNNGELLETLGLLVPTSSITGGDPLDGNRIDIISGTGAGETATILSNTGQQITVTAPWGTAPDSTSAYRVYAPSAGTVSLFVAR